MTYCESLVTSAVREYNDVELVSVAHTLQTRANHLQEEFSKTSLEICESPTISDISTDELATKIANVDITFNEISPNNTTAVMPLRAFVEKELNVEVISRDSKGKELYKRGAIVSGKLVPVEEKGIPIEAKSTDCGDGTYLVSLRPQQLGEHELSLIVKGQPIQGTPFNVSVQARDYTTIKNPAQTVTGVNGPWFIAFSNNGDMFVTSCDNHCIYVYDNSGRQKTTIGSKGSGPLQFTYPTGITISGDIMYVAENGGYRIHKLTLGGEFLGVLGSKESGKRRLLYPKGICIGPDDKIYVADNGNNSIQVFNQNGSICRFGNNTFACNSPYDVSFDCSGHLHVTSFSKSVTVFSSEGQCVRQYGQPHLNSIIGIAIDSAGYSLVVNNFRRPSLSIFDPHGTYIHSIGGFGAPIGVAVAPDGSSVGN